MTQFEENTLFYYEAMLEETKENRKTSQAISSNVMDIYKSIQQERELAKDSVEDSKYASSYVEYQKEDLRLKKEYYNAGYEFKEAILTELGSIKTVLQDSNQESKGEFLLKFALEGADEMEAKQFRYFLEELAELDESVITDATQNIVTFFDTFTEERMSKLDSFQNSIATVSDGVKTISETEEAASENSNYESLKNVTTAMLMVGGSLVLFSGMVKMLDFRDISMGLGLMVATTLGIITISKLTQKLGDPEETSGALQEVGKALLLFGGALALYAGLVTMLDRQQLTGALMLTVAALGIVTAFAYGVEKLDIDLSGVGKDLAVMSLSLIAFAGSLGIITYLVNNFVDIDAITTMGIVLGITAAGVALMGKLMPTILKGSIAMGAISASLALFGASVAYTVEQVTDHGIGDYLKTLAVIGATTAVVAGAGFLLPFILPGALALGAMGASLAIVGLGLKQLQDVNIEPEQAQKSAESLSAFLKPYVLFGAMAPLVLVGSGAIIAASLSMMLASKVLEDIPDLDEEKIAAFDMNLTRMLKTVSMDPTGISRLLGSDKPSLPEVLAGSAAIIGASVAIIDVVDAMKAALDVDISEREWQKILHMVGRVPMLFAEVETSGGFSLFGKTIVMNDVQRGIASIKGVGEELKYIVDALVSASDVDLGDPNDPNSHFAHIQNMIAAVPGFFASYGQGRLQFLGLTVKESDAQKGIQSIKGAGDELHAIVKSFTEIGRIGNAEDASEKFATIFQNYMDTITDYDYDKLNDRKMRRVFSATSLLADQISTVGEFNNTGGFDKLIGDMNKLPTINDPVVEFTSTLGKFNDELEKTSGFLESISKNNLEDLAVKLEEFIKESKFFNFDVTEVETKEEKEKHSNIKKSSDKEKEKESSSSSSEIKTEMSQIKDLLNTLLFTMQTQNAGKLELEKKNNALLSQMVNEISGLKRTL